MAKDKNAEKLDELEKAHGRIAHVLVDGTLYVFRSPTLDEFEDYQENLAKKRRGACHRELAQLLLVHPALESLQAAFARYPLLATRISDAVADMAGADLELTVKKG